MRKTLTVIFLMFISNLFAQTNCEAYKLEGNLLKYKACKQADKIRSHYQFTRAYQEVLDKAIEIDTTYHNAYWAKSIAYLKSGDFLTWKKLIDKAVKLNPKQHLGYRGWCRYQFFRDYKGAIADIERFETLIKGDIGYCQNGDYHLLIAKAICYKAIGQNVKAIQIIENYLAKNNNESDLYNFYHLGVLYFEKEDIKKALNYFKEQEIHNDLAENQFYIALCYKAQKDFKNYRESIQKSKKMYNEGYMMKDSYTHIYDKVYLSEIKEELEQSKK